MPFNHFDFISPLYDRLSRFDRTHPLFDLLDLPPGGQSFSEALRGMPRVQRAGTPGGQSFSEALRGMPRVQRAGTPGRLIILDIGGGTGRIAQALVGGRRQVVVVDLSPGMLLKAHAKPGLMAVMADSAALPFQTGRVARVLIVDALHHIKQQEQTIHELCRLLIPDGAGVVVEPDTRAFEVKLIRLMEAILLMGSHFLKDNELLDLFAGEPGRIALTAWRGNILLKFVKRK